MSLKQIKVLHVYKTSLPQTVGGIEVFLDTLCRKTSDLGIHNTIFSLARHPHADQPIILNGYPIIQAKENLNLASTGFSLSAVSILPRLAAQADLIHYHFPNPFADFLHFFCKINKPAILTYHADIIKQKLLFPLYRPIMERFLNSVKCVVTTSPQYFSTSPVLQKFKEKVRIIPIGLDKTYYSPPTRENLDYWKNRLPFKFFLFIGALRYYKGLNFLLDALEGTNFHLVIAGIGDMERALKDKVKSAKLSRVSFLGQVSDQDKFALLNLCQAFVFPSFLRSEAFGISLLESAMCGKPAISTEIGTGTSLINIHEKTGLVVPAGDADALRKAMIQLYENDEQAILFGKNAEKRYESMFTAEKQAAAYKSIYEEILS